MKKHPLTLLEMMIALVLVGFLLTGLFQLFYRSLKTQAQSSHLKQTTLQYQLFDQQMKHLALRTKKIWTAPHESSSQEALFMHLAAETDPEPDYSCELDGMLYLAQNHEVCFVQWSPTGKARQTTLLDRVDDISFKLFDPKHAAYKESWPQKEDTLPPQIEITIHTKKEAVPFAFFPETSKEPITYVKSP